MPIPMVASHAPHEHASSEAHRSQELFGRFAKTVAVAAGKPVVFLGALVIVLGWAITGPLFGFSDTWQLIINTGTTIVTFLMVFLIQNTQNRDTLAIQVKLAELIIAMRGAHNQLAVAEEMSDDELEALHKEYHRRADEALQSLTTRRSQKTGATAGEG